MTSYRNCTMHTYTEIKVNQIILLAKNSNLELKNISHITRYC